MKNQCAYKLIENGCDKDCDGLNQECLDYVTIEHIKEFYQNYGIAGMYSSKLLERIKEFDEGERE